MVLSRQAMVGTRLSAVDGICQSSIREIVSPVCLLMIRGNLINPAWFELYTSRGLETPALKSFMRFTVIISDYLLYVPALLAYAHYAIPQGRKIDKVLPFARLTIQAVALTLILVQPSLVLIDHGHFQYSLLKPR
jgi:alpha-1,3-glucosyltransferase